MRERNKEERDNKEIRYFLDLDEEKNKERGKFFRWIPCQRKYLPNM
jgi:hypothetical protein